jgi:hypothetical protein
MDDAILCGYGFFMMTEDPDFIRHIPLQEIFL